MAGEGIGDERYFVGRQALLEELIDLWRQPGGKPAVVLMGQRRIGKTSLLRKILRMPLSEEGLLAVNISIEGVNGAVSFWNEIARFMAIHIAIDPPTLNAEHPFVGFKQFLLECRPLLGKRRFLLMVDEVDLIPRKGLGAEFPGFLRTLMQEPEYPVLLLFCGTHILKQLWRNYDSIFFNTAHTYFVSYLNEAESKQVLQKPAQGYLEYSPLALEEAYRLTHGQPWLLQKIGQTIQNEFNSFLVNMEKRSNYVSFADMESAMSTVMKLDTNAAFENHWHDLNAADHWILSSLAWTTDETRREWNTVSGVEAFMKEASLPLPRNRIYDRFESWQDEQILISNGAAYRFSVPLYRRWIAWRWSPEKVREECMRAGTTIKSKEYG